MTLADRHFVEVAPKQTKMIIDFLTAAGYGPSDILSLNYSTRLFYMRNGGKYRFNEDGTIEDLFGPPSDPNERMEN